MCKTGEQRGQKLVTWQASTAGPLGGDRLFFTMVPTHRSELSLTATRVRYFSTFSTFTGHGYLVHRPTSAASAHPLRDTGDMGDIVRFPFFVFPSVHRHNVGTGPTRVALVCTPCAVTRRAVATMRDYEYLLGIQISAPALTTL